MDAYAGMGGMCLRFGKLNLLVFHNKKIFKMWALGTSLLKKKALRTHPVTRGYAIKFLDDLFLKKNPKWQKEQKRLRRLRKDDEGDEEEDQVELPKRKPTPLCDNCGEKCGHDHNCE